MSNKIYKWNSNGNSNSCWKIITLLGLTWKLDTTLQLSSIYITLLSLSFLIRSCLVCSTAEHLSRWSACNVCENILRPNINVAINTEITKFHKCTFEFWNLQHRNFYVEHILTVGLQRLVLRCAWSYNVV